MPAMVPDESQAEIDALYRLPLPEFTHARNALAKLCKTRGDAAAADFVKGLAKPSVSAWAVNQLWWRDRELFDELLASGDAVREAAQQGAGPAGQQGPSQRRRRALAALVRAAEERLQEGGHAAAANTMRRITTTLEACASYGSSLPSPGPGNLFEDLDPPGFDVLAGLMGALPPRVPEAANERPHPTSKPTADEKAERQREQDEARVREAAAAVDAAAERADGARVELDAKLEVHERLEKAAVEARRAADDAQRVVEKAQRAADAADKALLDARAVLADAQRKGSSR
jgi:hypothetical protein